MMFIYKGTKFRQSGTTMQKHVPPSEAARRARVRKVYPGFPASPFQTEDEIIAYTSGDTICCLMCGRHLKQLGMHLSRVHDIDITDYRERFNIPWRYGLDGAATREKKRENGLRPKNRERIRRIGKMMKTTGYRKPCELGKRNIIASNPVYRPEPIYNDFSWHLKAALHYPRPNPPPGEASWHTFDRRRLRNPDLQEAYEAAKARRPVHERTLRRRAARSATG